MVYFYVFVKFIILLMGFNLSCNLKKDKSLLLVMLVWATHWQGDENNIKCHGQIVWG